MRLKKITFLFFIFFILIFPISTKAQIPPLSEIPDTITEAEVRKFFDHYIAQYTKMDFNAFIDLFSKEVVENRMLRYEDIREIYRKYFEVSDSLLYHLEIYTVQVYSSSALVNGRYEVTQSFKGVNKKKIFQGNIQWNIIREGDALKIKEINYGRDH